MHRQENGFSLIEVLIAVLVLALGVIGAAGMQLSALRVSQQSSFQTAAVQLASEIADKMRANDSQMKLNDSRNVFLTVDYQADVHGEPPAPGRLCYADDCSGADLARFDIYEWEKRVRSALPGGRVVICRDAAPWDASAESFTWDCKADPTSSIVVKIGWQEKAPDGSLVRIAGKQFAPSIAMTVQPYTP